MVCYSLGGNTRRFAERLGLPVQYLSLAGQLEPDGPFVLLTPTYGGKPPAPVRRFLSEPRTRQLLRGVVCSGNRNFGADYAIAGDQIATECGVPHLHSFELSGMDEDVHVVRSHIQNPTTWSRAA